MLEMDSPSSIFAALAAGSVLKYAVSAWVRWQQCNTFKLVGKVSALYLWPVKSLGGITLEQGECTNVGLRYAGVKDRHWVISTKDGTWMTQRQEPKMVLIKTSIHGDVLHLDAPEMPTLKVPIHPKMEQSKKRKVTIKVDTMDSLDCGDEASLWICTFLNKKDWRLHFYHPDLEMRDSSWVKKEWQHAAQPGDLTAWTDFCSYMLMSDASLTAVNQRLDKPATVKNFRPNIMVSGCEPYDEDDWSRIRIGNATFRTLDSCTRCVLTTVDPERGVLDPNEEPLTSLRKFRLKDPYGVKPALGMDLAIDDQGSIQVGDPVYATKA